METINDRIRELVEVLGVTKTAFAESLKVSQQYISKLIKTGTPSDLLIDDICEKYNVSENWLRTGEGEMFQQLPEHPSLDDLAKLHNATESDYQLIRNYLSLDSTVRLQIQSLFITKE